MRAVALAAVFALAGCSLLTSKTTTLGGSPSSTSAPSTSAPSTNPGGSETAPAESSGGQESLDATTFGREEFHSLRGMTVVQAKAAAKKAGHKGSIKVEEMDEFVAGCAAGTVCTATDEGGGQSGMSNDDTLLLMTNKTLSIAPPPD